MDSGINDESLIGLDLIELYAYDNPKISFGIINGVRMK